jgi:hypothetical protein
MTYNLIIQNSNAYLLIKIGVLILAILLCFVVTAAPVI